MKLFLLHQLEGVGNKTLHMLLYSRTLDSDILALPFQAWLDVGVGNRMAQIIYSGLQTSHPEQRLAEYRNQGVSFLTIVDEKYPEWLRRTADPPVVFYYRGQMELLELPAIAMVGTRVATLYGKKVAYQFAAQLAERGICVVSGLAYGVDTEAHEGALSVGGATIAVLGNGVERVYPAANRGLYERIWQRGLLLSEYPLGTVPHAGLFPMRNRIIAGLSRGVIVVEAALRSGSLITADLALEESRDVFAVPGSIHSPKSAGTLQLIRQGAIPVTCIDDVLQEYPEGMINKNIQEQPAEPDVLSAEEHELLNHLSGEPVTFDELLRLMQYEFGQLHSLLLSLLLKKRILQHPGMSFTRSR